MKLHTGEKLFPCGTCGRAYKDRCGLTRHTKTHTAAEGIRIIYSTSPLLCILLIPPHIFICGVDWNKEPQTKQSYVECKMSQYMFSRSLMGNCQQQGQGFIMRILTLKINEKNI